MNIKDLDKIFDEKFTAVVSYEKWSDEDEATKLSEDQYLWKDWIKHNPKPVKDFIKNLLSQSNQEIVKEIEEGCKRLINNSDTRTSILECSQDGYEFGVEDVIKNLTQLRQSNNLLGKE
jgi:hypothetical protein